MVKWSWGLVLFLWRPAVAVFVCCVSCGANMGGFRIFLPIYVYCEIVHLKRTIQMASSTATTSGFSGRLPRKGRLPGGTEKLGVSLSMLSVQLQRLEESIGQPLFDRVGKSLVLTESDRIALDYADSIFRSGEELMSVMCYKPTNRRKLLNVGSVASLSRNFQLS